MPKDALHDLELLFRARHGLIHLDTAEEDRAEGLLAHVADRLGIPLFTWSRSQGISRGDLASPIYETEEPGKALQHVSVARIDGVYHFRSLLGSLAGKDLLISLLRDAAKSLEQFRGAIVVTGDEPELPSVLRDIAAHVTLPGPSDEEFSEMLTRLARDISERQHVEITLSKDEHSSLVRHLSGLTLMEAEKILTKAIIEDGSLGVADIQRVIAAKKEVVEREGLLEYYPTEATMAGVADLVTLKAWLRKRKAVVQEPERAAEFGLGFPKGVLLLGVPGCGKSLSAKAVAAEWSLPLLKLDPSNLYNKYVGESESNFKRAMKAAERMAPVVLWIDELEKAFASGGSDDGGVSQRVLGTFLSWMQDRQGDVFVVATANNIQALPPEFLRKGRFDEIFFVDLPDDETRGEVFRIHLSQRGHDPERFDLLRLAEESTGFSGSEIEEVVVSALYTAFSDGSSLDTEALSVEIAGTKPLSVTMGERISAMRKWAEGRAVRAN
jgi:SpoVK/Ycf46/Vps4 family AAA+-type ATPase